MAGIADPRELDRVVELAVEDIVDPLPNSPVMQLLEIYLLILMLPAILELVVDVGEQWGNILREAMGDE